MREHSPNDISGKVFLFPVHEALYYQGSLQSLRRGLVMPCACIDIDFHIWTRYSVSSC